VARSIWKTSIKLVREPTSWGDTPEVRMQSGPLLVAQEGAAVCLPSDRRVPLNSLGYA
jgi:hypothetical protein